MAFKDRKIKIRPECISFKFSRSAGPGGQNVNKVNTRVTVLFDLPACDSFSESQKARILNKLSTRADKNGRIRVVSQKYRTQKANRMAAIERLEQLLDKALEKRSPRKKSTIPNAVKERRLQEKKQRSRLKQQRAKKDFFED